MRVATHGLSSAALATAVLLLCFAAFGCSGKGGSSDAGSGVSASSPTASLTSTLKPVENGFDESANVSAAFAGLQFQIPGHFVEGNSRPNDASQSMQYICAEGDDRVAMIVICAFDFGYKDAGSPPREVLRAILDFLVSERMGDSPAITEYISRPLPNCSTDCALFHTSVANEPCSGELVVYCNTDNGQFGSIALLQTDACERDYFKEFERVLESAVTSDAKSAINQAEDAKNDVVTSNASDLQSGIQEILGDLGASAEDAKSQDSEREGLEHRFPVEDAKRAATVALNNLTAFDVFATDGGALDPSLFHSYSDHSGCYLKSKSEGAWSYKSADAWHVENMRFLTYYDTPMTASLDVRWDGSNYIISNLSGIIANPGYEEIGTELGPMEHESWCQPALVVSPELLQ